MQYKLGMCFEDFCDVNMDVAQCIFEDEYPHMVSLTNNGVVNPLHYSQVMKIMWDLYESEEKKVMQEIDTSSLLLDKYCEYACE